jgi:DNA polymerase-1
MQVKRSNLHEAVRRLKEAGADGLDTETFGLRFQDRLFSIIVADGTDSYFFNYLWYEGLDDEFILPRESIAQLKPIFENTASTFYISNAKFDLSMLRKEGIEVYGRVFCTNALGRVLQNNHFDGYSLERSAARIGLKKDDGVEEFIKANRLFTKEKIPGKKLEFKNKKFDKVPYDIMSKYAEMDARLHYQVGTYLEGKLNEVSSVGAPPLTRVADNEIALTRVCFEAEWAGIRVSPSYIQGAIEYENTLLVRAKEEFRGHAGAEFTDSNKFLATVFEANKLDFPKTEKGNPSFTDDVLEDIAHPLAKAIRTIRHHEKRIGTYYSSFLFHKDDNDFIHPNIRQGGTESGRFSYSDPNLQNIPKEDSDEDKVKPYVVRGSFIPRDGFCFVSIDFAQQEFRLMLDYAGETELIREIMNGADVHQATADLLGISRKVAKTINFGLLYGMGTEKLSRALDISLDEARGYRDLYFARLPKVKNFISQVSSRGKARGFVWNWCGRRCYLENKEFAYVLPNHLIQGGSADVIKFAMVKIANFLQGKQSKMVLNVHDELLFEVWENELEIVPILKNIMEEVYVPKNGLYLTCTVEHSWENWGSPSKIKGMPEDAKA